MIEPAKLPQILEWKFPGQGGIATRAGVITEWPAGISRPSESDLTAWEAEFDATATTRATEKKKAAARALLNPETATAAAILAVCQEIYSSLSEVRRVLGLPVRTLEEVTAKVVDRLT